MWFGFLPALWSARNLKHLLDLPFLHLFWDQSVSKSVLTECPYPKVSFVLFLTPAANLESRNAWTWKLLSTKCFSP